MKRRDSIKIIGTLGAGCCILPYTNGFAGILSPELSKTDFGTGFTWGAATAAYQIEGAVNTEGKSPSVWDTFSHKKRKIKTGEHADIACDFYNRFEQDIENLKNLNFDSFRFSLSWTRILPQGTGTVNKKGIDFYHRVIDKCLEMGIQPWITIYHWDLPQILEEKGGWVNRDIIGWFSEYTDACTKAYGDKVKNWMVLNEPVAFTVLGYLLGIHAPGKRGFHNLYPAIHHAAMCQAEGGRIIRKNVANANVGTTFSCSPVQPLYQKEKHIRAANKLDALLNRLYIEPSLGMGYPADGWKALENIYHYAKQGDAEKLQFDFDFIGIQNYTRIIARHSLYIPVLWGTQVSPRNRGVQTTDMGWEVYPEGIYEMLKKFAAYKGVNKLIITENGAAFTDMPVKNRIHDPERIEYYKSYLEQVLRAKRENINITGYFCWSLMDNFEWAEGYRPRFGLVYVDFHTQDRIIKDSGYWFKNFLEK